ncbi:MAG: prephenate dehydrogenase [Bacteroidia bacterium]|nr:prephenate dehydrogenase [Bacteroidia bacterium]
MVIALIGVGLIGGSMAIDLIESGFATRVIGVDAVDEHLDKALRRKIIHEASDLETAVSQSDIVIVSTPVDVLSRLLPEILNMVDHQIVTDVGSSKEAIQRVVSGHPNRANFVSAHPMAGTEHAGPEHAIPELFNGSCYVVCDKELSSTKALEAVQAMYEALNMCPLYMTSANHDVHAAYVSHISHISSFALALTVLEKEKDESRIFEMASGGFSSTVRLAKSNPKMWVPIFEQNRDNVLDVLDEHINTLSRFRSYLIKKDFESFDADIHRANDIKRILAQKK